MCHYQQLPVFKHNMCTITQEKKKLKLRNIVSSTTIEVKRKEYTICESFIIFPPMSTAQQEPTIAIGLSWAKIFCFLLFKQLLSI
ncbi:hypothetical protein CMV_025956 [Castanea mollissima]|uniref:Uncharacterized protein n=1 Tax=Castanea mollissima TaxID=60419 RepID=A0A8J4QKR0_9ROSI|nr:hypothetical protein CMV_025956 [Castanea mollissima]